MSLKWTSHCSGFSGCGAWALGAGASVVGAHRLSCSMACGIFLDQGLNPCPLHWQPDNFGMPMTTHPYQATEKRKALTTGGSDKEQGTNKLPPTRILQTGVGCHFLLQGIFPTQGSNLSLLCLLHCKSILYHLSHQGVGAC